MDDRIVIKQLTPELIDDWLYFFDNVGFTDYPEWHTCYCRYPYFEGTIEKWDEVCESGENRSVMIERIKDRITTGLLAYRNNQPVGWCHMGPRKNFCYPQIKAAPDEHEDDIGSIVCFVIAPGLRRQRIATLLLREACVYLRKKGFQYVEVYPRKVSGEDVRDEAHFTGPFDMYVKEGFIQYKEFKNSHIMRKRLT